ncbi:MAG: hypothetical protein ACOY5B_02530 [Spirochaetota bacterium]
MTDAEHVHWAREILRLLVGRVLNYQGGPKFITYTDLAQEIEYPKPRTGNSFSANKGKTLGVMGHLFDNILVDGWNDRNPHIQALIVAKDTELPGEGLKEFYPEYPTLSKEKRLDHVSREYLQIYGFDTKCMEVLQKLGISAPQKAGSTAPQSRAGWFNPFGKDGSPEHRAIRDYIAKNPDAVKVTEATSGHPGYALKSGDSVDVVIEAEKMLQAIEVKSLRSGPDDLQRGVYQCVKYRAVLRAEEEAFKRGKGGERPVRTVLVCEGALPRDLQSLAALHSVTVFDNLAAHRSI